MSTGGISVAVLLESIKALETARIALCKHGDTADAAFVVARALGMLRAHTERALPASVPVEVGK